MSDQKIEKPISMFVLFAQMFSITAKRLEKEFGPRGLEVLKDSVQEFGYMRGQNIARRAAAQGQDNTVENYLDNYDMERSELFGYTNKYQADAVCQEFTRCIFADTWIQAGEERYGRIYCENIDPAIALGYNAAMQCQHDHIMYADHKCTFCFKMKQDKKNQ
jgi:hypothetical protein